MGFDLYQKTSGQMLVYIPTVPSVGSSKMLPGLGRHIPEITRVGNASDFIQVGSDYVRQPLQGVPYWVEPIVPI